MKKIIIFLIIIFVIYLIATQIKVFHIKTLPQKQQTELFTRSQIRSILTSNHIKCQTNNTNNIKNSDLSQIPSQTSISVATPINRINTDLYDINLDNTIEHFDSSITLPDILGKSKPNSKIKYQGQNQNQNQNQNQAQTSYPLLSVKKSNIFFQKIKDEYLDTQYKFNIAGLPTKTRNPNKNTETKDKKYLKHIRKNIENWNEIFTTQREHKFDFEAIRVQNIKLIFISETECDFLVKTQVELLYLEQIVYLDLTFYGQIEVSDDIFADGSDIYIIQLVEGCVMSKSDYRPNNLSNYEYTPFMTMEQNATYANKINKMHKDEMLEYANY